MADEAERKGKGSSIVLPVPREAADCKSALFVVPDARFAEHQRTTGLVMVQ